MGTMMILNRTGHPAVEWDQGDPASVERARKEFRTLRRDGFVPFKCQAGDTSGALRIDEFDEKAEEIVWLRPLQGG